MVVTPLRLEQEDEDTATDEITWLLYATNHLLTVHKKLADTGVLAGSEAVGWPLPTSAEQISGQADNKLVREAPTPGFTLEESVQILWEPTPIWSHSRNQYYPGAIESSPVARNSSGDRSQRRCWLTKPNYRSANAPL